MNRFTSWGRTALRLIVASVALLAGNALVAHALGSVDRHTLPLMFGATLAATNPTLLDLARATDPNGNIADIAEIMNQVNEILDDMSWVEGNLPTGHRTTIRTGIPTPTWRRLYGGVQPNKATNVQVTDDCGMLEAYAEVDKALADLNGNTAAFRLTEDRAHIEGISQEIAKTLFYGDSKVSTEKFTGLAPRFNTVNTATAQSAFNVIDAGGVGSANASMWLVAWGPRTAHGVVPKGSKAGLQMQDKGQVTIENADGNGGRMEAYRTHYRFDAGLTVRDWRYVARTCNIDIPALATLANTKNLLTWMIQMEERLPYLNVGRPVFYVNRTIREKLRLGIIEKITTQLTWETVAGKRVMMFDGIPVKRVDQLLSTEARLT